MSTTARIAIGMIFLVLSATGPLAAQDGRVPVEGAVIDSSGRVLIGADVFLRDLDSGLEIHQVTDSEGRFQFLAERGTCQVTAAMSGFDSASQDLNLEESGPTDLRLQLAPAPLDTQVVVVSGSREQELIENSTTKVDVIPKRLLHDSGYETVRDVLSEEPGIVTRSGSSGSRSETQIQGIDSRQSLILVDGLPVVGAKGIKRGILNMDRQSIGRLERIEIVKGASSAVYGSDAIGGVINMITREPRHPLEASVTTSGGSLNRFDMRADVGFVKDKWSGFFEAERHKQNPFNLIPSRFGTTGPGFHRYDYLGKLGYEFSDRFRLRATAHAFVNQDKGAYFSSSGPTDSITDDTAQHYALSADVGLSPLTQWNVRGFYGKYDESSVLDILPQPGPVNSVANLNQRLYRFDSSISHVLGARQLLHGGVEWTQDEYRGFNRVLGDNDGQDINMVDFWINDRVSLHDRFVLTLGSRFNRHNLYGSHFVPRASGLFRVAGNFRLRGAVGRGFRAPDLGQLFFRFQNPTHHYQVIGNTHLQPERSTTYQAGFDYGADTFRFAANFFRNDIQELIQAEYIGFPTNPAEMQGLLQTYGIATEFSPALFRAFYLYRNVDNVYTSGVESKIELKLTRNLLISTGYTYLDARDKATDAYLSGRHRHHGNFRIFYSSTRFGGWRTNLRGTYFSKWPVSGRGGLLIGEAHQIWDWYVAKPIARGVEMYFVVDNLLDSKDPGLDANSPSFLRADPGRLVRVGLRWSFNRE